MKVNSQCAKCPFNNNQRICRNPGGRAPEFCATVNESAVLEQAKERYLEEDTLRFAEQAARQEASSSLKKNGCNLPIKPRMLEIVELCKRMGYKHLGLAFCGGLHKEAKVVCDILEANDFTVSSAMCKIGGMDRTHLGLENKEGVHKSVCNPIGQAYILNDAKTEFNIVLGLCVGHDSLFLKHSEAMCTILAVKDRMLAHNPLGAIYNIDSNFKYLKTDLEINDDV